MNKREEKQYLQYKSKLNISTETEDFVLLHILQRDWNRSILLYNIEEIKENAKGCEDGVNVKCTTNKGSYWFSVSIIGGSGWIYDDVNRQKSYISGDLYHKMN